MKTKFLGLAALMALLVGGAWALTGSSSANAAPGNGATVINDTQCFPWGGGWTACITQKGEFNSSATKSGNTNYEGNFKSSFTITDSGNNVVYTSESSSHYHALWTNGTLHESGNHFHFVFTSGGLTCTGDGDFHYANGSIQYSDFSFACV